MKPSQIKTTLLKLVPMNEPVLLVGSPGVGKTDTITAVAAELEHDLIVSHPVVDDPTDYKGMPSVIKLDDSRNVAQFLPFGNLQRLIDADQPTIAFADDLGQAPPAVQAAYMQLVLARKINGHPISPHVKFLAATNRRQDKAAVTGMITPLLDRFTTVLTYEYDEEDWVRWALDNGMPPMLVSFVRFRGNEHLAKFNHEPGRDMKKTPTPRSAAAVGRLVNHQLLDPEVIAGAAGEAFASEFLAFYRTYHELPPVEAIYKDPKGVAVPGEDKPDVLFALMGKLASKADKDTIKPTLIYIDRCPPEFAVMCVKDAIVQNKALRQNRDVAEWSFKHKGIFGYED